VTPSGSDATMPRRLREVRMKPEVWILLSGALSFGVPLVLAVGELLSLRRGGDGGFGGGSGRAPAPPPPPPLPPAGSKRLPECLIPRPAPNPTARARVLEDA
jgi:hypothetical protein